MSLDDLNREQKRSLKSHGALNEQGQPTRAQPQAKRVTKERVGPVQYLREVRDEMRKVAWPKWPRCAASPSSCSSRSSIITAYVGGLDALFGLFSTWLYD
jgi:preprotein translocase subunit SecE